MNKSEFILKIAENANLTKAEAERVLNATTKSIEEVLASGDSIALTGFGTFQVKERSERTGRNPQTGEAITIPASKTPHFKPGKNLKESVN